MLEALEMYGYVCVAGERGFEKEVRVDLVFFVGTVFVGFGGIGRDIE